MTAPQVCTRCRKRRIRCDLQLPACKNCRLADVECFFWDNALGQEVPCSYLYSLRQRVAGLKRDLELASVGQQQPPPSHGAGAVSAAAAVVGASSSSAAASVSSTATAIETAAAITALADLSQGRIKIVHPPPAVAVTEDRGDYHLLRATLHIPNDGDIDGRGHGNGSSNGTGRVSVVPSQVLYLGLGSAARLAETVLKGAVDRHVAKGVALPRCLRGVEEQPLQTAVHMSMHSARQGIMIAPLTSTATSTTTLPPLPPLTILHDVPRKEAELHTLVPLATQRALLEHYSTVVGASSPCYDSFLPVEQEAALLQRAGSGSSSSSSSNSGCSNPLKWASAHRGTAGAYATSVVFAIATALAARDLGKTDGRMAALALRFRDDVQAIVGAETASPAKTGGRSGGLEKARWAATALAALAFCEMVQPATGGGGGATSQLWDLLGAAVAVLADLREGYSLRQRGAADADTDYVRLERTILRMEARAALHLRRPSSFCDLQFAGESWREQQFSGSLSSMAVDDLVVLRSLLRIRRRLEATTSPTAPHSPDHVLENLIPIPLQVLAVPPLMQRQSTGVPLMSAQSATLYLALHPAVVASAFAFTSTSTSAIEMNIDIDVHTSSLSCRLFQIVAAAACVLLDEYTRLNAQYRVVSLWMGAERAIEAGIVWVTYILWQRQQEQHLQLDLGATMRPILQVSSLLSSFAARWKAGSAYVDAWDALVELLWGMV